MQLYFKAFGGGDGPSYAPALKYPQTSALALFCRQAISVSSETSLSETICFRGTRFWREQDERIDGEQSCRGFQIFPQSS